jgi:hypothetical protein
MAGHSQTDIKIDKVIYSNGSINKVIDRSFSELISEDPTIDVEGFFKQYNQLFYDIPKSGSKTSHFTLIDQSTDYLQGFNDPKDDQIQSLLDRIIELELQLSEVDEIEEHPFYKNGSILIVAGAGLKNDDASNGWSYYMDRGRKRKIAAGGTFSSLRSALGLGSTSLGNFLIGVKQGILNGIPWGPNFTDDSLANSDKEWEEFLDPDKEYDRALAEEIKKLDPDGITVKQPYDFQTDKEYEDALFKDIGELEKVLQFLEENPEKNAAIILIKERELKVLRDVYALVLRGGRDLVMSSLTLPETPIEGTLYGGSVYDVVEDTILDSVFAGSTILD